ncbi:MAG: aminoacyl-histidine dipeptidase [Myxococcota bacterium]
MTKAIEGLKPQSMWKYFAEMSRIPRCSKNEEKIISWLMELGRKNGIETKKDKIGNILIKIPASKGYEDAPTVVLQGHMDMVCEKNNDTKHCFKTDSIELMRETSEGEEWITANGTTLGADNGIGLAAGLALLDEDLIHGPIEVLATVDEETGMTGAFNLESDFVEGRLMLNLDSEEDGAVYVGCAGGAESEFYFDLEKTDCPSNCKGLNIKVKGLRGGHSGLNVHENRANALRILSRLLKKIEKKDFTFHIYDFNGGTAHNAIPRESAAKIAVPANKLNEVKTMLQDTFNTIKVEYDKRDVNMALEIKETSLPAQVWSRKLSANLIDLVLTLPNGVLTMSQDLPDLVESSTTIAIVETRETDIKITVSSRSSVQPVIKEIQETNEIIGKRCGAKVELSEGYPGWQPDMDSPLLEAVTTVFKETFNKDPEIKAIHAGLETGVIGEKYPGIKMISFGPEIHGAHSPDEKVSIKATEKFWALLSGTLEYLAKNKI